MATITVSDGQTLIDIAIQQYGCYEGVFDLIKDNEGLGLSSQLVAGQVLNIKDEVPTYNDNNVAIALHFRVNKIRVNSQYLPPVITGGFYHEDDFDNDFDI